MVFPVVRYGCESWTVKKDEHQRIHAFELWYWRRLLRVPWTPIRSNQSIPKEISPGCSLEGLMLKLKLQYFGPLMQRADSFEKTLMLGKIESRRRSVWQRMRWLDGVTDSTDMCVCVKFSVVSNSLRPHEPQHARPPCPSPTPGVYPNSCPLSRWCHPTISSSVVHFSCPQSFPASGLFKWVSSLHQGAKGLEFQLQHQSFQWTPRTALL